MESEGCWEVITRQSYKHHVFLGCSQTCFSFPGCTDLTHGCNLRVTYVSPTNIRALDIFNIQRIAVWILHFNEFLVSSLESDARTNKRRWFLPMQGCGI